MARGWGQLTSLTPPECDRRRHQPRPLSTALPLTRLLPHSPHPGHHPPHRLGAGSGSITLSVATPRS